MSTPPVALTVAGSDSGAGAGIQADLKTFAALRVFGTCAVTAVTAQNTVGVLGARPVPADFVRAQIDAVLDDFDVRAVKTGLLATAAVIELVVELAEAGRLRNLVVDPVMVTSTGVRLLDRDAERLYVEQLFPRARVATPNLREAGVLLGTDIRTLADQRDAATRLASFGPQVVVVKGGHAVAERADVAIDVVAVAVGRSVELVELSAPRVDTSHSHGSGCSFASAIAAGLAHGRPVLDAVTEAKATVHRAIAGAVGWNLGAGHGPLDHFGWDAQDLR